MHPSSTCPRLDFVIAGFAKCGSTSLWALLREHPALFLAQASEVRKEPNFFSLNWDRGWEWYAKLFDPAAPGQRLGEASNSYAGAQWSEQALDRMLDHYPELRFIFIVRDPAGRIASALRHMAHLTRFDPVPNSPQWLDRALGERGGVLAGTCYQARLRSFRKRVGPERIHVVFLEDLVRAPAATLAACFRFLGVDPEVVIDDQQRKLNDGEQRLFDTPRMHELREDPTIAPLLEQVSQRVQDQFLVPLGLRRSFGKQPIEFSFPQERLILDAIEQDVEAFLAEQQRDRSVWPTFTAMAARHAREEVR